MRSAGQCGRSVDRTSVRELPHALDGATLGHGCSVSVSMIVLGHTTDRIDIVCAPGSVPPGDVHQSLGELIQWPGTECSVVHSESRRHVDNPLVAWLRYRVC